jgi:hypothetical protein
VIKLIYNQAVVLKNNILHHQLNIEALIAAEKFRRACDLVGDETYNN